MGILRLQAIIHQLPKLDLQLIPRHPRMPLSGIQYSFGNVWIPAQKRCGNDALFIVVTVLGAFLIAALNRRWIIAQGIISLGKNFFYLFPSFFAIFVQN
jgi:hypothetical protein